MFRQDFVSVLFLKISRLHASAVEYAVNEFTNLGISFIEWFAIVLPRNPSHILYDSVHISRIDHPLVVVPHWVNSPEPFFAITQFGLPSVVFIPELRLVPEDVDADVFNLLS